MYAMLFLADWLRHQARLRRLPRDHALGLRAEDLAHRYLRVKGMRVVARNYRTPGGTGEIDLAAWDRDTLVFVEVKARSNEDHGEPERAVDEEKRLRLLRAARDYLRRANLAPARARFDIVTVVFGPPLRIRLLRDAFSFHGHGGGG
jgi:putative endonuclease